MAIIQNYLTKNPCFNTGRDINVVGLMLHSVGVPQPNPLVFIRNWNKETYKSACVHGFIGEDDAHITLPCLEKPGVARRGWHAGKGTKGTANDTHLGFEMCEPKYIKYTKGATFTITDKDAAIEYVKKTTRNAVVLFAKLCKFHGLDPLKDGVIISHYEGNKRGIASGHADPDHLWRQLDMNYNMDTFRQDVNKELQRLVAEEQKKESNSTSSSELARFKKLFNEMRQELRDNDAGSWSKEAREWAVSTGLVQGSSEGQFNGAWEDFLTREQLITVLYRFAQLIGKV